MRQDGRLSGVLHVMLHMAEMHSPTTSETLAGILGTNPAVIRRIMAGLRDAGFVHSAKGHGGGWTLTCDLGTITLCDIYAALGKPDVFAMGHRNNAPHCLVEQVVNAALEHAFRDAEMLLLDRFSNVTLADLSADFHASLTARGISLEMFNKKDTHGL